MKICTIANQKGGVGKTSIAVHLAHYAAEAGHKVVVVDLDGQANATGCFVQVNGSHGSSMLFEAPDEKHALPLQSENIQNIYVVPSDTKINDVESLDTNVINHLKSHLKSLRGDFDLVIIDTPPTLGKRLVAALIASDFVLTPFEMEVFAIEGIRALHENIQAVRARLGNPGLKHIGILPNRFNARSKSQNQILKQLKKQMPGIVLPTIVHNRVAIADALAANNPVWKSPQGASAQLAATEMRSACKNILERIFTK